MVHSHPAPDRPLGLADPPPTTVWTALATEQQERVIHLLAQLACALAALPAIPAKEQTHACPTQRP
jgi:hypothetical protein